MSTKIGVICDLHLHGSPRSPQHAFLKKSIEALKELSVNTVICLGDITARGEISGLHVYQKLMADFDHYEVAGNSDVRDPATEGEVLQYFGNKQLIINGRTLLGINTPYSQITAEDRQLMESLQAGDVLFLHHDIESLDEDSRAFIRQQAERTPITILHGHLHRYSEQQIGMSRIIGLKCLDPDKNIGSFPCVTILDIQDHDLTITEYPLTIAAEDIVATSRFFGISCVDNRADVSYALEHGISKIELRCIDDWKPDWELLPLIQEWRNKTSGYLSVHMPDIRIKDGTIIGMEQWEQAADYALAVGVDGLTMHPPRVKKTDIPVGSDNWNAILKLYTTAVAKMNSHVRIGIENLHVNKGEVVNEHRGFGYTPDEVKLWISSIEDSLGVHDRIGHVLDVGHARNNGSLAEMYPIGRWYELMGNRTVAYHIHQVIPEGDSYRNHCAIENWFGPMINYTSFFYSWHEGLLNHVPAFLEVKGHKNYEKSVRALHQLLEELRQL